MSVSWNTQQIARAFLIFAVVILTAWTLSRFLPALAWAGVLAIATWPARQSLAHRGMEHTAIAGLLTLVTAVVLVLPMVGLVIEAAHERDALGSFP